MIARGLLVMAGATLLGIGIGMLIGRGLGTYAPSLYMNDPYNARTSFEAIEMGTGYGAINGSILGVVIGGIVLLYDLGHRFLSQRESN